MAATLPRYMTAESHGSPEELPGNCLGGRQPGERVLLSTTKTRVKTLKDLAAQIIFGAVLRCLGIKRSAEYSNNSGAGVLRLQELNSSYYDS